MANQKLIFSHKTSSYVFIGKEISPPPPGSYDAANWTPPTQQVFRVEIQHDGMWRILLNDVEVASGDYSDVSQKGARHLVERFCAKHLE